MKNKKTRADKFPHVKGLVKKATKFGHRWILSAPDSTGKIKNITVKISDNDSIEDFYAKVNEARDTLIKREIRKTFQSWVEEYIIVRQLAKNSISALRINLRGFGLSNAMNREQVKSILTSGLKISTIKHKIGQINSFFTWLNQKVPEIKNPAIDVKIKANIEPRKRTATDEEIEALLARIKRRKNKEYLLFALLLIHTGARVSTICELKASDMTNDNHLRLYNVKSKKTYDYLIPITDEETLSLWREVTADGKLWHQPTSVLYRKLKKLMERMFEPDETGERLSVHSLRHTFASKAIRSGLPIEVVSKLLDHKSVSTTLAVYARFSQNQIDDAVLKINRNNC
jgi:site-specific recombinase XerD